MPHMTGMNWPMEAVPLKGWAFSFLFSLFSLLIKRVNEKKAPEKDKEIKIKPWK